MLPAIKSPKIASPRSSQEATPKPFESAQPTNSFKDILQNKLASTPPAKAEIKTIPQDNAPKITLKTNPTDPIKKLDESSAKASIKAIDAKKVEKNQEVLQKDKDDKYDTLTEGKTNTHTIKTDQKLEQKPNLTHQENKTLKNVVNLAQKHDLNPSKIKIQTLTQNPPEQLVMMQDQSQKTKVQAPLAQALKEISLEDTKNRKINKNAPIRQQIIENKIHAAELNERFQSAIKDFEEKNQAQELSKEGLKKSPKSEKKSSKDEKNPLNIGSRESAFTQDIKANQNIVLNKAQILSFANQVKEAINNYRPPITKLQIELNPKELGKVELNITKNGNDLQVSITSNNQAINLFWQNQNTLLQSLQSIGFEQVDLNFSSQNGQKDQNEQRNQSKNNGNENSFIDEEIAAESLTITLPAYV